MSLAIFGADLKAPALGVMTLCDMCHSVRLSAFVLNKFKFVALVNKSLKMSNLKAQTAGRKRKEDLLYFKIT